MFILFSYVPLSQVHGYLPWALGIWLVPLGAWTRRVGHGFEGKGIWLTQYPHFQVFFPLGLLKLLRKTLGSKLVEKIEAQRHLGG